MSLPDNAERAVAGRFAFRLSEDSTNPRGELAKAVGEAAVGSWLLSCFLKMATRI